MTAPEGFDLAGIIPSKAKVYVALIGSLLTIVGPWILDASNTLSEPWPGVIGLVFAALTGLGVYQAPYKPTGTVLAPNTPAVVEAAQQSAPPPPPPPVYGSATPSQPDWL